MAHACAIVREQVELKVISIAIGKGLKDHKQSLVSIYAWQTKSNYFFIKQNNKYIKFHYNPGLPVNDILFTKILIFP